MANGKVTGNGSQFTYDFGINIAQQTVARITRLAGASLTLASAFYSLNRTATEFNNTLRENALRFGGMISTMRAMEQAQERLIKGQSYFTVDDQLRGMNELMSAGVKVGENLEWINKAAHATGRSFSEFAQAISSGISGSMGALVDMGLLTQRAARYFEMYPANTLMRQQAILNFVKQHKGLQQLIKEDFETIQDQMTRLKGTWTGFMQAIVGRPNDPSSLTGMTNSALKGIAEAFARNFQMIKQYGEGIGIILGWTVKQVGKVILWLGRQAKSAVNTILGSSETFAERMRSLVVWLEFWKLRVKDFFDEYGGLIKGIAKVLLVFWGLKKVFVISEAALASVRAMNTLLLVGIGRMKTFNRMIKAIFTGGLFAPVTKAFKIVFPMAGRLLSIVQGAVKGFRLIKGIIINLPKILLAGTKAILRLFTASNPIGWIALAISGLVLLYKKSEQFRNFVNNTFTMIKEALKLVWNSLMWVYVNVRAKLEDAWKWVKTKIFKPIGEFFSNIGEWITNMWTKFKDTTVGKWIDKWIVQPIKGVIDALTGLWTKLKNIVGKGISGVTNWLRGANEDVTMSAQDIANARGYSVPFITGDNKVPATPSVDMSRESSSAGAVNVNPIIQAPSAPKTTPATNEQPSTFNLSNGAVQIIVHKGGGIDEYLLAAQVKKILEDMQRQNKVRTGG